MLLYVQLLVYHSNCERLMGQSNICQLCDWNLLLQKERIRRMVLNYFQGSKMNRDRSV